MPGIKDTDLYILHFWYSHWQALVARDIPRDQFTQAWYYRAPCYHFG